MTVIPTIQPIDPRTGEAVLQPLPETTVAGVDGVVHRAHAAQQVWRLTTPAVRAGVLRGLATALEDNIDELVELADIETGLGLPRLTGEVGRTSFQLRMFADELDADGLLATRVDEPVVGPPPAGRPRLVRTLLPLGPVAVFGASNFPFAFSVLGGDTASALAAGCVVVVKEHPSHPTLSNRCVEMARQVFEAAALPADIVSGVRGFQAGQALVDHPQIAAVGFTGSPSAGRALFDRANARSVPIPFYGELGSVNPVFITSASLATRGIDIATEAAGSITMGRGQFCTKPSIFFVPNADDFVAQVSAALAEVEPGPLLSPSIASGYRDAVSRVAGQSGVTVMGSHQSDPFSVSADLLVVDAEVFFDNPEPLLEECFGPAAVVVRCESDDDVLRAASMVDGALVGTIHAEPGVDQHLVARLVDQLGLVVGRIVFNGWPTGLAVSPWQHHGGPYPATTSVLHTSVGLQAMMRFVRPLVIQNATPDDWPDVVSV